MKALKCLIKTHTELNIHVVKMAIQNPKTVTKQQEIH